MRSLLITPCRDDALAEAWRTAADALILDLSAGTDREAARRVAGEALRRKRAGGPRLIVGLSEVDAADLDALMAQAPEAIWLQACGNGADVQRLGVKLAVGEATHGLADGSTRIYASAAARAGSLFELSSYIGCSARLSGLAWDAAALAADLGLRQPTQREASPLSLARDLTLFAARAAGVPALDAASLAAGDLDAVRAEAEAARDHGFAGKLASDRAQIAVINEVFESARPG